MQDFFFKGNGSEQMKAKGEGYDAGHLIADSFGGPDDERNLVPMLTEVNRTGTRTWYAMEGFIRKCLEDAGPNASGWMEVKPVYDHPSNAEFFRKFIPTRFKGFFRISNDTPGVCRMKAKTRFVPFDVANQPGLAPSNFGNCFEASPVVGPANPANPDVYPFAPR